MLDDILSITNRIEDMSVLARGAVIRRDMAGALDAMHVDGKHCFVWPETYQKIYHYQRVCGICHGVVGLPIVMRSARTSMFQKYTKRQYFIMAFERYIRIHRITIVDKSAWNLATDFFERMGIKHQYDWTKFADYAQGLSGCVIVNGTIVPIDRERILQIESGLKIIEKIDRLKAA